MKEFKTANSNSPWAYIREGLLPEGYLRLRVGELIFGRAYFSRGLLSQFYGTEIGLLVCKYIINQAFGLK